MVQVNRKAARFYDAGMIDTFEAKSFLSPAECAGLRAELRQAAGSQATVLSRDPGGEVKPLVRRSTRMRVPARTAEQITARLMQQTDALEQRFGHALSSCEPPQFLRYLPGDFFVAHQDGNTPLIHRQFALPQGVRGDLPQRGLAGARTGKLRRRRAGAARALFGPGAARTAHALARHAHLLPRRDDAPGAPGHARGAVHHRILVLVSA